MARGGVRSIIKMSMAPLIIWMLMINCNKFSIEFCSILCLHLKFKKNKYVFIDFNAKEIHTVFYVPLKNCYIKIQERRKKKETASVHVTNAHCCCCCCSLCL